MLLLSSSLRSPTNISHSNAVGISSPPQFHHFLENDHPPRNLITKLVTLLFTFSFLLFPTIASSSRTSEYNDPLEFTVFPGIDQYLYIKLPYYRMIDKQYTFYSESSSYFKNDRLLLKKSLDLYNDSLSYADAIQKYDEKYQRIIKLIEDMDVSGKIALDAKEIPKFFWKKIRPKLIAIMDFSEQDEKYLSIFEEVLNGAVDIALEKYNVKTAVAPIVLGKFLKERFINNLGFAFAIYDGAIKASKLVVTLKAIIDINKISIQQSLKGAEYLFINEYVLNNKSDIEAMKSNLVKRIPNYLNDKKNYYEKNTNNFWMLWWLYLDVNGYSDLLYYAINDYDHERLDNGSRGIFDDISRAAIEVSDYINDYGHNGIYSTLYSPQIVPQNNGDVHHLTYKNPSQDKQSLYFMPKNIRSVVLTSGFYRYADLINSYKNYRLLFAPNLVMNDNNKPSLKTIQLFDNENGFVDEQKRYVSSVRHYNITINFYDSSNNLISSEKKNNSANNFYIIGYLGGLSDQDYSNKHIVNLFNDRIITGNSDGSFSAGKEKITIGELLKISTLSLIKNGYIAERGKNINNIQFSKYVLFLSKNGWNGISTGYSGKSKDIPYEDLKLYATRGYMAKLMLNIMLNDEENQVIDCGKSDVNGWDDCSLALAKEGYVDKKNNFRPNDYLTRDEAFKVLDLIHHRMME